MSHESLEDVLQRAGSAVQLLRNSQIGPYAFPVVPLEFTNWRDEQRSWRETCALFDQSHHMTDLYIEGPDAVKLLSDLGINSFKNFKVNQAKQFVACNPDGYVIGDAILFYLSENRLSLVGRPSALNWVEYNQSTGGYNVKVERDERSAVNRGSRKLFRFQVQGPNALKVIEKVTGQPAPDIRFFNMGAMSIGGQEVRALRHGMVGQPGWELFGPWAQAETGAQCDPRSRTGVRDPASRCANLSNELPRVGVDSVAASRRLHRRQAPTVPTVVDFEELRGDGLTRRQFLFRRHQGLLPDTLRSRLRAVREVRPRVRGS
jgi:hypothetical protein